MSVSLIKITTQRETLSEPCHAPVSHGGFVVCSQPSTVTVRWTESDPRGSMLLTDSLTRCAEHATLLINELAADHLVTSLSHEVTA